MKDTISIVIATYGDENWRKLALERALPSAENQDVDDIVVFHEEYGTAASCRNKGISKAKGNWIIICDADDELEPGYAAAMRKGLGDLRYPRVRYVPGIQIPEPVILGKKNLLLGNYMVIGTMFKKVLFQLVGGFGEFKTWEDWFLFMQMTYLGAVPMLVHDAIYRIYQHTGSRVSVPNPGQVFQEMLFQFKEWAFEYNGGESKCRQYDGFLHGG